ncbi:MAG: DUF3467 domain-containing protein [Chloroflexi bacterium]|nr:DUF3467 domain-containing protein [Chloroflexota bacterium]MDL1885992.1 DUF3467 domain-containing protein [Anaerolineae bacterium CFX8]
MQQPPRKLQLEIPANLNGVYANAVIVSHTYGEIVLDFIQIAPNDPRARVQARVMMTPANAKLFLQALGTNLERFEATHGEIKLPPQPASLADQLFGGIKPDEGKNEGDDGRPQ